MFHDRLLNLGSKRENLEILTTLLVILTVIQPFICIHPVIVWSQDSNNNSTFLLLIILIWFLPIAVHVVVRALSVHGRPKCGRVSACASDDEKSVRETRQSAEIISSFHALFYANTVVLDTRSSVAARFK